MGCFNVSCGMSGISMYADKAVLIPLTKDKYGGSMADKDSPDYDGAYFVSNDGAQCNYNVRTLPIYGSLNTYGSLEEIESDENTEILEAYYGRTIYEIADMASNSWRGDTEQNPKDKPQLPVAGMWVNRRVYDEMSKLSNTLQEYGGEDMSAYSEGYIDAFTLRLCGFEFVREDTTRERYQKLYVNPEYPGLEAWCDGTWTHWERNGKEVRESVYHPKGLDSYLLKTYGSSCIDVDRLKQMSSYELPYLKYIEKSKEDAALYAANPELKKLRLFMYDHRAPAISADRYEDPFIEIYGSKIESEFIKQEYLKFKHFDYNMFACNKTYGPTFNGFQHGNFNAERKLHEVALQVIKEKREEYEED